MRQKLVGAARKTALGKLGGWNEVSVPPQNCKVFVVDSTYKVPRVVLLQTIPVVSRGTKRKRS